MSRLSVLVIDAGLGNIGSVMAAFQRQDCAVQRASKPPSVEVVDVFTHAVLPGVGAFAAGMDALKAVGWDVWIKEVWRKADRPLLGICLGMQLLASEGTEGASQDGVISGLDLIPGRVERSIWFKIGFAARGLEWLNWHHPASALAQALQVVICISSVMRSILRIQLMGWQRLTMVSISRL